MLFNFFRLRTSTPRHSAQHTIIFLLFLSRLGRDTKLQLVDNIKMKSKEKKKIYIYICVCVYV